MGRQWYAVQLQVEVVWQAVQVQLVVVFQEWYMMWRRTNQMSAGKMMQATTILIKKRKLAERRDAPVVRERARGSREKGLAAAAPANQKIMLANLEADKVARSSTWHSRWKTWCQFHREWLGEGVPPLPLTMHSISCVAASLKEGCYSSAADYFSTAKAQHLKSYEWASMLARQHTVCLRSALRG